MESTRVMWIVEWPVSRDVSIPFRRTRIPGQRYYKGYRYCCCTSHSTSPHTFSTLPTSPDAFSRDSKGPVKNRTRPAVKNRTRPYGILHYRYRYDRYLESTRSNVIIVSIHRSSKYTSNTDTIIGRAPGLELIDTPIEQIHEQYRYYHRASSRSRTNNSCRTRLSVTLISIRPKRQTLSWSSLTHQ